MEDIETLIKLTSKEQVGSLIANINEINVFSNNRNYEVKEIEYSIFTKAWLHRKYALPWQVYEFTQDDFTPTIPDIKINGIKVHLHYLM